MGRHSTQLSKTSNLFFWVLLWAIVHILDHFKTADGQHKNILKSFSGKDAGTQLGRITSMRKWHDPIFEELVKHWWGIAKRVDEQLSGYTCSKVTGDKNTGGHDQLEALCVKTYVEYMEAGYEFLDGMEDTDWPGRE
ncbi:hypothetical protein EVG20_g9100 [Dentipellis fragilis]|uniref:Uncharacterized protein n=1 Tax=Dentipellis fragilis TaxID=205917 RepID=A0A4Y9Y0J2_9AGAM|nr:hypothetical protein EVG20_g9100 [Dentipellis fragilis]